MNLFGDVLIFGGLGDHVKYVQRVFVIRCGVVFESKKPSSLGLAGCAKVNISIKFSVPLFNINTEINVFFG